MRKPMNTFVLLLSVITLILACVEVPVNPLKYDVRDFPKPPSNVKLAIGDGEISLLWQHPNQKSIRNYQIQRRDSLRSNFELVGVSEELSFTDRPLQNGRVYFYKISCVDTNGLQGSATEILSGIPAVFGVLINNGQASTNSRSVSLTFAAPKFTSLVMVSNDSSFENGQWGNFTTPRSWVLSQEDGLKTVYVKFRNNQDVESNMSFLDNIILDTQARISQFVHDGTSRIFSPGDILHLRLQANETGGVAQVDINNVEKGILLYDDGTRGDVVEQDGIYEVDYSIPTGPQDEGALVIGRFTDKAGNVASSLNSSSGRIIIRRPPTPVNLIAVAPPINSSRKLTLTWSINTDSDFANYRIFRSQTPGITERSPLLKIIQNPSVLSLTDSLLAPNTTYYYRVYVYDQTGLFFGSNERSGATNP